LAGSACSPGLKRNNQCRNIYVVEPLLATKQMICLTCLLGGQPSFIALRPAPVSMSCAGIVCRLILRISLRLSLVSAVEMPNGNLLLTGMGEQDDRVRLYLGFEQAAASGDPVAAYNCAVCLAYGVGVARDDGKLALWLRQAADRVPYAQFWYGRVLAEGRGANRDPAEGRRWIARAAEAGIADAQVALGEMMLTGTGGVCDPPGALALFEKAAASGHLAAMFAIGVIYDGAHGVPANHRAAQHWFRAAAEGGHPAAHIMLERYAAKRRR
jgi:hypothetical protein